MKVRTSEQRSTKKKSSARCQALLLNFHKLLFFGFFSCALAAGNRTAGTGSWLVYTRLSSQYE